MELDRDLLFAAVRSGVIRCLSGPLVSEKSIADGDAPTDGDDPPTSVIASTSTPDRYGDIIVQQGWDLAPFARNPVILSAHDYKGIAIGRGENIRLTDHQSGPALAMDIVWDVGVEGGRIAQHQFKAGFARGVSVGFRPIEWQQRSELGPDDPRRAASGMIIQSAELLELSTASVPVQAEALAARSLGDAFRAAGGTQPEIPGLCRDDVIDIVLRALELDGRLRMAVADAASHNQQPAPRNGVDALADWLADME